MDKEKGVDFTHADPYYQPAEVPQEGHFYVPVACQQCRNPPCTKVCPDRRHLDRDPTASWSSTTTGASAAATAWPPAPTARATSTGPNAVDPAGRVQSRTRTCLGNRPRPKGVVEKCTFCIQRTRTGRYPACVEVCPVGARKFGNLLDQDSEIRYIIEHKRVMVLKEELNTLPKFFYFYAT